jgi:hypothetical protein
MVYEVVCVVLAAKGLVVKNIDAAEVRIAVAEILAAAAEAVFVAHHVPKLGAHLVTARPVEEIAWRQEARGGKKAGGGGEDAAAAGDKQLGSCAAGYIYMYSGKLILAAMCLRRDGSDGFSYVAEPT